MLVRATEIDLIMKTCTICGNDVERRVKLAMDMGELKIDHDYNPLTDVTPSEEEFVYCLLMTVTK